MLLVVEQIKKVIIINNMGAIKGTLQINHILQYSPVLSNAHSSTITGSTK